MTLGWSGAQESEPRSRKRRFVVDLVSGTIARCAPGRLLAGVPAVHFPRPCPDAVASLQSLE